MMSSSNKTPSLRTTNARSSKETKTPLLDFGNGMKMIRSRNITPSRNMDFKGPTEGDRYIPQHNQDHMNLARTLFHKERNGNLNTSPSLPSNSPDQYRANLMKIKSANDMSRYNDGIDMFVFRREGAPAVAGTKRQNVIYKCMNPSSSVRKTKSRVYPKTPIQAFDAEGLVADYYYNILDWSSKNLLAIAVQRKVYIINVESSVTDQFVEFENPPVTITSLKFSKDGAYLAIGLDNGFIHVYRVDTKTFSRKLGVGNWRICSLAWTMNGMLSFGNRGGLIQTHDTRISHSYLSEMEDHEAEVCGLNWVCQDKYLVSGSADATVNVYTQDAAASSTPSPILYKLEDHTSTVKAITQCTFMYGNIIATSGGLNDGTIKFWNLASGELVNNVVTNNQTSAIVFDDCYREMATAHGGNQSGINVWKYSPSTTEFTLAHEVETKDRPMNMVVSPCNEYIAMTGDAEELSFFDLFKKDEKYVAESLQERAQKLSLKFKGVRQHIR